MAVMEATEAMPGSADMVGRVESAVTPIGPRPGVPRLEVTEAQAVMGAPVEAEAAEPGARATRSSPGDLPQTQPMCPPTMRSRVAAVGPQVPVVLEANPA